MGGNFGVQGTEEVLKLLEVVVVSILKEVKRDGFQVEDLGAFLKSPDFETAVGPALKDIAVVPQELMELDLMDDFELGRFLFTVTKDIRAAVSAPVAAA